MNNGNGNYKRIVESRSPFTRSGEVVVRAKDQVVIPDKACTHNMDRDFEVPYLTVKLTALAKGAVCDVQPEVLDRFIALNVMDLSRNLPMGDSVPLVAHGLNNVYRWTPTEPFLIRRGDSWRIAVHARESFEIAYDGKRKKVDAIRVEVTFDGDLLYYATPMEYAPKMAGVEAPLG